MSEVDMRADLLRVSSPNESWSIESSGSCYLFPVLFSTELQCTINTALRIPYFRPKWPQNAEQRHPLVGENIYFKKKQFSPLILTRVTAQENSFDFLGGIYSVYFLPNALLLMDFQFFAKSGAGLGRLSSGALPIPPCGRSFFCTSRFPPAE